MKTKIFGILVCMLLIAAATSSLILTANAVPVLIDDDSDTDMVGGGINSEIGYFEGDDDFNWLYFDITIAGSMVGGGPTVYIVDFGDPLGSVWDCYRIWVEFLFFGPDLAMRMDSGVDFSANGGANWNPGLHDGDPGFLVFHYGNTINLDVAKNLIGIVGVPVTITNVFATTWDAYPGLTGPTPPSPPSYDRSPDVGGGTYDTQFPPIEDNNPPTTTKTIADPKYGPDDEYVTSYTEFNLTAVDDGVGVNHTYYRIWYNGLWTTWNEYMNNFTLTGEGKHYIEFFSIDYLDNVEEVNNQTHYVDDAPPTTTKTITGPKYGPDDEGVTSITEFNLTAVDDGVGVNHTYYRIWYNGLWTPWMEYTGNFTLSGECKHYIEYFSIDFLGNVEEVHNQTHYVDETPPTTTKTYGIPYGTDGVDEWITPETPITLDAVDGGICPCGLIMEIWYNYGAGWNVVPGDTATFTIPGECTHLIEYYSVDNLGNVESVKSQTVKVDNSTADAGGPYTTTSYEAVQFDSSDSHVSPCCVPATYLWEFGDGDTSTEQNPTHTYPTESDTFTVTLTIITQCFSHTDTTTVTISASYPPIVQLIYPQGGEILDGTVTIEWYAHDSEDGDNLPIYLYYFDEDDNWYQINDVLENTGEYDWDITELPDGTYKLQIVAQDSDNNIGHDSSETFQIKNHDEPPENEPPNKPSKPSGPTSGKAGTSYSYLSSTTDVDGDQIWYKWDWGDETSGWDGPYDSGDTTTVSHVWDEKGDYSIKVKAKDVHGEESPWSDPLPITMPKNKAFNPFILFLERLMERFPILEQILQPIYDKLTGF